MWNSLPEEVVGAPSVNYFKGRFDMYCEENRFSMMWNEVGGWKGWTKWVNNTKLEEKRNTRSMKNWRKQRRFRLVNRAMDLLRPKMMMMVMCFVIIILKSTVLYYYIIGMVILFYHISLRLLNAIKLLSAAICSKDATHSPNSQYADAGIHDCTDVESEDQRGCYSPVSSVSEMDIVTVGKWSTQS